MGLTESIMALTFLLIYLGLVVVPLVGIARKMGYSGALGLLAVVPGVNIILAWALATREWPIERNLRLLRSRT